MRLKVTRPMRAEPAAAPVLHSIYMMRVLTTSNENKMSDGGRDRASLGVNVWKSSQKWSAQRSVVRSIAWLDGLGSQNDDDLVKIPLRSNFLGFVSLIVDCPYRNWIAPLRIDRASTTANRSGCDLADSNPYLSAFFRSHGRREVPVNERGRAAEHC